MMEKTAPKSITVWLTGLSGSGKTTLAKQLKAELETTSWPIINLDGDELRKGIHKDLDFTDASRKENIRRTAELSNLLNDSKISVIASLISPFEADRQLAKEIIGSDRFIEVFCDCPLSICQQRDVKGLYQQVDNGEIKQFTGISSAYEIPLNPTLHLKTAELSISDCLDLIKKEIRNRLR
ncbi:MAG: adenylyl-sulfate kinase [Crocinitomicaceae bacterium]|nr:adenylyl-sulfate kinase [Crocinitomicaceae bacterium]